MNNLNTLHRSGLYILYSSDVNTISDAISIIYDITSLDLFGLDRSSVTSKFGSNAIICISKAFDAFTYILNNDIKDSLDSLTLDKINKAYEILGRFLK